MCRMLMILMMNMILSTGCVFLAEDMHSRDAAQRIAVKEVLLPPPEDDHVSRDRKGLSQQQKAEEEVRVLRKISGHVNIVSVFESFLVDDSGGGDAAGDESDSDAVNDTNDETLLSGGGANCIYGGFRSLYITQEYCDGGDLSQFLSRSNSSPLHQDVVLGVIAQLLNGLQHIHAMKILHRDLKASNVMLLKRSVSIGQGADATEVPICKLCDFGISKVLTTTALDASTMVGTPYYLSPELCRGQRYNSATDIWSMGCILYELVTLRRYDTRCPVQLTKRNSQ